MIDIKQIKEQFQWFESQLEEQNKQPIQQVRKAALQILEDQGLPTKKDEDWRFTDPHPLLERALPVNTKPQLSAQDKKQIERLFYQGFEGIQLVFLDGHFLPELSTAIEHDGHIHIAPLSQYLSDNEHFLDELQSVEVSKLNAFSALNTAFFTDGIVIEVPDKTILKDAIHILNINSGSEQNSTTVVRNIIKVGAHAFVRLIETHLSLNQAPHFSNVLTTIELEKQSKLIHNKIQNENAHALHVKNVFVRQKQSATYVSNNITLGGRVVRNNIKVLLQEDGAEARLNGLYMGHNEQHHDNHTLIEHASPNCTSHELYQGILADKASAVFAGKILVDRDAQKTDAIQSNNCLLLSDNARIDTMPQLEIYADDVKCTHGATVGQLDEEAIFYLRTRGISENRAKNLLIYAFAEKIIEQLQVEAVRKYVDDVILQRFKEDMNFVK